MTQIYLDSSAVVKLALAEPESKELGDFLRKENPVRDPLRLVSSDLTRTETLLACRRVSLLGAQRARSALRLLSFVRISATLAELAGLQEPASLRSLDSLHLVTALLLSPDLMGIVTYDSRMASAAKGLGLDVFQPGVD
jgi:predicted nucleic acid-binding protein